MNNNFSFSHFLSFECLSSPFHALGCQEFWFNYLILFLIVCLVLIYFLLNSYIRERAVIKLFNEKMKRKHMVADAEVMNKHKWKVGEAFDATNEYELSQKMRDEMAKRPKNN
jgi:hypothetical protein